MTQVSRKWLYGVVFEDVPHDGQAPDPLHAGSGVTVTDLDGTPVASARVLVTPTRAELERALDGDADPRPEPVAEPVEAPPAPAPPGAEAPGAPDEGGGGSGGQGGGDPVAGEPPASA